MFTSGSDNGGEEGSVVDFEDKNREPSLSIDACETAEDKPSHVKEAAVQLTDEQLEGISGGLPGPLFE